MLKNPKLYSVFIICILTLLFFASSSPSKPYEMEKTNIAYNEYSHAEDELQLRYYLRKFWKIYEGMYGSSITLNLNLFVEGSDDIDSVLVMCTPPGNSTYNQSMTLSSIENLYTFNFTVPIPENLTTLVSGFSSYTIYYEVQYFVNTSSGQSILSGICPYQFYFRGLAADAGCTFYDTPDLWYLENTTGHEITWDLSSGYAEEYSLREDGYLIEHWKWSGPLTINVDGLSLGNHEFSIYAKTGGWGDSETVTVHVVTALPFGVNTDDAEPITSIISSPIFLVSTGVGLVTLVAVILVIYKYRIKNPMIDPSGLI